MRRSVAVLVASLLLAGCGGQRSGAPEPPREATIEGLVADPEAFDGREVEVEAYLLVDRESSVLTDRLLESYPPQAGSPNVWVTAPDPEGPCLERGNDGATGVRWGSVVATGVFRYQEGGGLGHLGAWTMALERATLSCP